MLLRARPHRASRAITTSCQLQFHAGGARALLVAIALAASAAWLAGASCDMSNPANWEHPTRDLDVQAPLVIDGLHVVLEQSQYRTTLRVRNTSGSSFRLGYSIEYQDAGGSFLNPYGADPATPDAWPEILTVIAGESVEITAACAPAFERGRDPIAVRVFLWNASSGRVVASIRHPLEQ